jgi:hypothetical protein
MEVIKNLESSWDREKKTELVKLGQSNKPYPDILVYLENEIVNSKRMVQFDYKLYCFRNDGIYQLNRAIEELIGAASVADQKKGPSGEGTTAVPTVDVILADGTRKKVPYGKIMLPHMGKDAHIEILYSNKDRYMVVRGECQFKFQTLIDRIVDKTKLLLNTDSIYKSQAIEINGTVDAGQPQVLDLSNIDREHMILSEEVEYALSPLKARILHTEKCLKNGIPMKFGALLEGPYGTGKTLLAFKLAKEAIKNGWSFIYLKSPELLAQTLRMSKSLDKNGNGIIVFVEDIDQVTRGDRNAAMQDILNTLDGGDTKDMNVIALFTTNHLELIDPTFLRGKRIGTIITMPFLNAETAEKYIEHFCDGIKLQEDFAPIYEFIGKNKIAPAFMAEIIENVKSNMVLRDEDFIKASHFQTCINSYLRQVDLSKTKDSSLTKEKVFATALKEILHDEEYYEKMAALTNVEEEQEQ